jgi:hypothetical protein
VLDGLFCELQASSVTWTYRVRTVLTPVFEPNINLHKTLKNNNSLMKLSGIVYLRYSWTLHLADEIAFSNNDLL